MKTKFIWSSLLLSAVGYLYWSAWIGGLGCTAGMLGVIFLVSCKSSGVSAYPRPSQAKIEALGKDLVSELRLIIKEQSKGGKLLNKEILERFHVLLGRLIGSERFRLEQRYRASRLRHVALDRPKYEHQILDYLAHEDDLAVHSEILLCHYFNITILQIELSEDRVEETNPGFKEHLKELLHQAEKEELSKLCRIAMGNHDEKKSLKKIKEIASKFLDDFRLTDASFSDITTFEMSRIAFEDHLFMTEGQEGLFWAKELNYSEEFEGLVRTKSY